MQAKIEAQKSTCAVSSTVSRSYHRFLSKQDHRSLPLDTQQNGTRVGAVHSNVVRIDVLEVGLCPYTLAPATHVQCVRHPIGVIATATMCLQYPYVLGRNVVHRFASTGRVTERERGGGTVCAIGFRGNASII